jgi:hypothetical protein
VTIPVAPPPAPPAPTPTTLSPQEIELLRQNAERTQAELLAERQRREALEAQVTPLVQEREAREEAERQRQAAEAQAEEERRRSEMSFKEQLTEVQNVFTGQISELQQAILNRDALLQKEREFHDLMQYRADRLAAEANEIMPTLTEFVTGNTRQEIDAAIDKVKNKTAETVQAMAQAGVAQRIAQPGASITGAPSAGIGPVEEVTHTRQMSVEELREMPMAEYAANRAALLGAAAQGYRDQGMFR